MKEKTLNIFYFNDNRVEEIHVHNGVSKDYMSIIRWTLMIGVSECGDKLGNRLKTIEVFRIYDDALLRLLS